MTQKLKLFDDIERTYTGMHLEHESLYSHLNRSASSDDEYIRNLLQGWFDEFLTTQNKKFVLWQEFRGNDQRSMPDADRSHLSALFELYLYIVFKRSGFQVEVEPDDCVGWEKTDSRPDFRLTTKSGEKLLVEATGAYSTDTFLHKRKFEGETLDYLNQRLKSKHLVLRLFSKSRPRKPLIMKKVYHYLQTELDKLQTSWDEGHFHIFDLENYNDEPFHTIFIPQEFEWRAEFFVEPRSYDDQKVVDRAIIASDNKHKSAVVGIRDRIKAKKTQFGETSIPYILAINVCYSFFREKFQILDALFGDWHTFYKEPYSNLKPIWIRENGAFFHRNRTRATNISGLLILSNLQCGNITFNRPTLYHHPFSKQQLNPSDWEFKQKAHNFDTGKIEEINNVDDNWIFNEENMELYDITQKEWLF